jgi:hypothetical protein
MKISFFSSPHNCQRGTDENWPKTDENSNFRRFWSYNRWLLADENFLFSCSARFARVAAVLNSLHANKHRRRPPEARPLVGCGTTVLAVSGSETKTKPNAGCGCRLRILAGARGRAGGELQKLLCCHCCNAIGQFEMSSGMRSLRWVWSKNLRTPLQARGCGCCRGPQDAASLVATRRRRQEWEHRAGPQVVAAATAGAGEREAQERRGSLPERRSGGVEVEL